MYTLASAITIHGTATFLFNAALNGGGIYSAQGSQVNTPGIISFVGNSALTDGGAMYIADPYIFNISGVSFNLNVAFSGGAVSLASTEDAMGAFHSCQFEGNNASNGGALYLSPGEGNVTVHLSTFKNNVAGELGGALFSAGDLFVSSTKFEGNSGGTDGLAIYNLGSFEMALDASFDGNMFRCPPGEYSDTEETSKDTSDTETCRFSVVCANCFNGCASIPSTVYMDNDTVPVCTTMPTGVEVSSTSVTLADFDLMRGYYRVSNTSRKVLECYQPDACDGGVDAANYCAAGYEGPYCAVCANDMAPGIMRRCHECSAETVRSGLFVLAVVVILVTIVVASVASHLLEDVKLEADGDDEVEDNVRARRHHTMRNVRNLLVKIFPLSAIRIVVVVLEIITQFTEIAGTVYPDEYEVFISRLAFSNVDIGVILSSFCIVRTNFYDRLLLATVGPLVLLLALGSTYAVAKRRNRNPEEAAVVVKHKHLSTVLFVTFILYSSVSFTIFQTFICDTLDDGGKYLRADFSLSCKTDKYTAYKLYAILMMAIYPIGIPVAFGWWLVRNRRDLKKTGREAMSQLKPFRGLWAPYRPSRYYYEIVEYGRRVMLTGAAVFVVPGSSTQIAVIVLLAVVFLFISESLSPFECMSDLWLYRWGNGIILASMYVALLLSVELAEDGSHGTHVVTALLISANAVMLLAVVVQAVLAVKVVCSPVVVEEVNYPQGRTDSMRSVHPTDKEGLDCELELSIRRARTPFPL